MQKLGKCPNFGVISEIQRAKFGVFVTYIFGGKIWGSNKNFRRKFWGQVPRPIDMEVPPPPGIESIVNKEFYGSCVIGINEVLVDDSVGRLNQEVGEILVKEMGFTKSLLKEYEILRDEFDSD